MDKTVSLTKMYNKLQAQLEAANQRIKELEGEITANMGTQYCQNCATLQQRIDALEKKK